MTDPDVVHTAERLLLQGMLIGHPAPAEVRTSLAVEDFHVVAHQHLVHAIYRLVDRGQEVDVVTVCDELDGRLELIGGKPFVLDLLVDTTPSSGIAGYATLIRNAAEGRRWIERAAKFSIDAAVGPEVARSSFTALVDEVGRAGGPTAAFTLNVVTIEDFASVREPGADSLLGDDGDGIIPAGADVMIYGDGGAGKTTLTLDFGCHLACGADWLGITIGTRCNVLAIENEGPRALFRRKLDAKLAAWTATGHPSTAGRFRIVDDPWAELNLTIEDHRAALAEWVASQEIDLVFLGPVVMSGMIGAGTMPEVREFMRLLADVRARAGRTITFVLIHHENRGGKVSGAWEGAVDTMLHVTGMGNGKTRLFFQKARWSSTWHGKTLDLLWADGASFTVDDTPKMTDDDLVEQILDRVGATPGITASKLEQAIKGVGNDRIRHVRDRLLTAVAIVNRVKVDGTERLLAECPPRKSAQLYLADDPAIRHLRQDPGAVPGADELDLRHQGETPD